MHIVIGQRCHHPPRDHRAGKCRTTQAESPTGAWEQATRALVIRELLLQRARKLGSPGRSPHARRRAGDRRGVLDPAAAGNARSSRRRPMMPSAAATTTAIQRASAARICSSRRISSSRPRRRRGRLCQSRGPGGGRPGRAPAAPGPLRSPGAQPVGLPLRRRKAGGSGRSCAAKRRPSSRPSWSHWSPASSARHRCARATASMCFAWTAGSKARRCRSTLVRDRIAAYLEERTWRRAVAQYIALVAGQAQIAGFDLPAATSPLVQ